MKKYRYFIISSYCAFSNQRVPFPLLYPTMQLWVTLLRAFEDLYFGVITTDVRLPSPVPQVARNRQLKNNIKAYLGTVENHDCFGGGSGGAVVVFSLGKERNKGIQMCCLGPLVH